MRDEGVEQEQMLLNAGSMCYPSIGVSIVSPRHVCDCERLLVEHE